MHCVYCALRAVETHAASTFTAFETIINGISECHGIQEIVDKNEFKKIRKVVEDAIKGYCIKNDLGPEARCDLYKKVGELRFSPIIPRAAKILEEHEIYYLDIIKDESMECWLREIYEKRSIFIHSGRIKSISDFAFDVDRLQALTERLVYKLLGGEKEWLSPMAYRHVSGI